MSHHFAKPENALRKALDLVKVKKDDAALRILHSMLLSRRYRIWQQTHEQIMLLYVQLAVDNRKNAKDGLLQYRNICQAANVESLEKVIKEFMRLAEAKATDAQAASSEADALAEGNVPVNIIPEPLDESIGYRPEVVHYFVPGVGGEDEMDRNKRQIVTPWLKYLWDTYRTVLDVMRNNAHLDKLYHKTVRKALAYCTTHVRTSEFRRLCEIMRIHLNAIVTYQGQPNSVDISNPETLQAYLRTRFAQLECASTLDLWQEAYRIIEDIHELLLRSKINVGLDQSLLSTYYQKLELIFWKSSNPLFHTYCVDKRYQFALSQKADPKEISELADRLIVATLSIRRSARSDSARTAFLDGQDQKNLRLSSMLGFLGPPSRTRMMARIEKEGILAHASPIAKSAFALMSDGRPRSPYVLSKEARPLLETVAAQPHLAQYAPNLTKAILLIVLQQCARVYKVLRLESFMKLLPADIAPDDVERLVILWVKEQLIRVRVDHIQRRLAFDTDPMAEAPFMEQLPKLSSSLQTCVDLIHPTDPAEKELQRMQIFQLVKQGMDHEHRDVFIRTQVIEKRKQENELAAQRREYDERVREQQRKQKKMEEEQARLQEEKLRREREREERIEKERIRAANLAAIEKLKAAAAAAGGGQTTVGSRKIIETLEEDYENVDREKLLEAQSEVATQEQRAKERKLKDDFKRLDYTARALRLEERPLLIEQYDKQRIADQAYYDEQWQKHVAAHRARHEENVADRERLARMATFRDRFYANIMERRTRIHQEAVDAYEAAVHEKEQERAAELKRLAAEEAERERLAEEENRRRLAEEEADRERQAKVEAVKAEKERAERERREALDRQAELQRKREAEVESRKRAAASAAAGAPSAPADAAPAGAWRRAEPVRPAEATRRPEPEQRAWRRNDDGPRRPPAAAGGAGARDFGNLRSTDANASSADAGGSQAPRLKLAGKGTSGTSWRDREAAKKNAQPEDANDRAR
ncbi:unnamed protein product (mitochondrion) [Plasmodiophora brassicae]|uniref:PCI domain-containing protein n=1 Tax=Plasmodiophora brassicae TaxID=37360 RepID=A0A0G4J8P4_PLABS|nr:hypothetical protein PBRA_009491 [Plasmodiophora brassicae]SPQ94392.1 unnamed protein product [Plasmodiophora brassicae]